jgi:hypothetical protein
MGLSRTLILTNFPIYINYINIKNRKKIYKKKHHLFWWCLLFNIKI